MSNLKCPFCQQELKPQTMDGGWLECWNCSYREPNSKHLPQPILCGSRELWQELIRTRKALAFAKSKLNGIHRLYSKAFYTREDWLQVCMEKVDKANTALNKITALEQKDK